MKTQGRRNGERVVKGGGFFEIVDSKRTDDWMWMGGGRVECGLKSQFENAWEDWIGRGGWREEGRLKSQIENTWEERIGRGRLRKGGGLKLHFTKARDDRMGRGIEIAD